MLLKSEGKRVKKSEFFDHSSTLKTSKFETSVLHIILQKLKLYSVHPILTRELG